MAQGIEVPLKTRNGRLKKLMGDDYIDQIVRVALLGMESENPFQTLGLGEFMIFGINDTMSEGEIRSAAIAIFDSLKASQLAKLDNPDKDIVFSHEDGDMSMDLSYINMETQERSDISVPIPSGV